MQRFELKRHVTRRLAFGRRVGDAEPTEDLSIRVLLHPKDDHALAETVSRVCDPRGDRYGRFLSADEVRRLVAPGYQDLDAVLAWLHDSGLKTDDPVGARTVIRARGSAEAIAKMLDIPIGRYSFRGLAGTRFAAERNPSIPAPLAAIVRGIAGLNDLPAARRFPPIPAPKRPVRRGGPGDTRGPAGGYTPSVLAAAYRMPPEGGGGNGGESERIGIVEFGGGYRADDLVRFCDAFDLPFGEVSEVSVGGARNDYGGKTGDADTEVALDLEWARAAAPHAPLAIVWAPNVDHGWVDVLARVLDAPDATRPSVFSISWGMPEDGFSTSRRYDQVRQLFQSASLLGVTFVAASGDNGASDEPPGTPYFDGQRHVDFPAILPEVTAVGGTKLVPGARGFTELVWNDGEKGGASGGGYSRFVKIPDWQKSAIENRGGFPGRGVPDVAAVASPDPGLAVHVHGRWGAVGGTSVAAPIWAGFLAQVNAARIAAGKARLGAANSALYGVAGGRLSPFRDVLKGDNSFGGVEGFAAGKGWDPVTGLGSPDVAKLIERLTK